MNRTGFLTAMAFTVLAVFFFCSIIFAAEEERRHKTGLREPTARELEWRKQNMLILKKVKPNARALDRYNAMRNAHKMKDFHSNEIELAPQGEEITSSLVSGPLTATSQLKAGNELPDNQVYAAQLTEQGPFILPDAVDNSTTPYFPPIADQGSIGACAAFATTYYTMTSMTGLTKGWNALQRIFSPKWTFNLTNNGNDGSTVDGNASALICHGGASLAQVPSDLNIKDWCTDAEVWRDALSYRGEALGYMVVDPENDPRSFMAVKQLLANGYVLPFTTRNVFGWGFTTLKNDPGTSSDDAFVGQDVALYQDNTGYSGHAMTIVGYNDNVWADINNNGAVDPGEKGALKVANSWGALYRNAGFLWVAYNAVYHHSQVAGAPFNANSGPCIENAYWLTVRAGYQPKVYAEFTVNTLYRDQMLLSLGIGTSNSTSPDYSWTPFIFWNCGGPYAFDGTTTACNGNFVLDYTDLMDANSIDNKLPRRWYLQARDNAADGHALTLSANTLVDQQDGGTRINAPDVPITVENDSKFSVISYQLGVGQTNYPPNVVISDTIIIVRNSLNCGLAGIVTDDGLPTGNAVILQWNKISGPGTVTFTNPASSATNAIFGEYGTYVLRLTANDSQLQGFDSVVVSLMPSIGYVPFGHSDQTTMSISGNFAYVSTWQDLSIIDVSNPANPSRIYYSPTGYYATYGIAVSGNYAYLLCQYPTKLSVYDVSYKQSPILIKSIDEPLPSTSFPIQALTVSGDYLYCGIDTLVSIYDISTPSNPTLTGSYNNHEFFYGFSVLNNTLALSGSRYFSIVNIADKGNPNLVKRIETAQENKGISLSGSNAFLATTQGLEIWDIAVPVNASKIGSSIIDFPQNGIRVQAQGTVVYLMANTFIYTIITSVPTNPVTIRSNRFLCGWPAIASDATHFYVGSNGLDIINTSEQVRRLSSSASMLDFGTTLPGSPAVKTISLSNAGNSATTVTSILIDNALFTHATDLPLIIPENSAATIMLTFNPAMAQTYTGIAQVLSNAMDNSLLTVSLLGTGIAATLTSIGVTPATASVNTSETRQFSAVAMDQFNNPLNPQPTFTWSVSGGGTITATGLFSAGKIAGGPYTVTAASGDKSGTASLTVSSTALPSPWTTQDIGSVSPAGRAAYAADSFTVMGSGADIWGAADAFRFVSQSLTGDATIIARVSSQTNSNSWAKSGLMFRETLTTGSKHVALVVTPSNGVALQYRATTGGLCVTMGAGTGIKVPIWLKLVRAGNVFKAYRSTDGVTWIQGATLTQTMIPSLNTGLCVCSHANGTLCTSGFKNVSATMVVPNFPPTIATAASANPNPVTTCATTVSVLGTDDKGEANLTYTWTTPGAPPAEVVFNPNETNAAKNTTATFIKAGSYTFQVTVKDQGNLTVASTIAVTVNQAFASIVVSPASVTVGTSSTQQFTATGLDQFGANLTFQPTFSWSVSGGGNLSASGLFTSGTTAGGPYTVTAFSGGKSGIASVTVSSTALPSPWITQDIGSVSPAGSAIWTADSFCVKGSGADIWGSADAFRFVSQSRSGNTSISARVSSQTNSNGWAKSGIMFREALSTGAKHVALVVTPSNGIALQYRASTNGTSTTVNAGTGIKAPIWLRLDHIGKVFTAYRSTDGVTWT